MNEMLRSRFQGLSGAFRLTDGRLIQKEFEIVNVFRGERTIGTKAIPKGLFLHGKKLRIAVPVNIGFQELIRVIRDPRTNETTVTGFCADVFKEAAKSLDYEVDYEFIPFVYDNGRMAGTYVDLIYGVYHKKFDAVVGDTTILASRFPFVDFTQPFTDLGIGVIVPKINKISVWIFPEPLSADLWITTAASFIFTGIVVWLMEHSINDEFQGSPSEQIGTLSKLEPSYGTHSQL
ncbi:hypothetical protein F3Y22_tig00110676pilonHSYRG00145 [Hibiscus syriacus]|uniref:Ionotropic glutamate receptor C-terminal domain-containing protein n=1 Tax=Hibiscus syriacus TaxID=106335 RepID=A0A6A2ZW50_HIBSY|nr:hypothetical protein F3Y22_tig00110676pilonHSYRG00145 [Hibiscus syriacus]